jgi:ABC-type dipeptide/oligopeptide/nickel transport system ATPase subunit
MITCAQLDVAVGTEIYDQLRAEHKKLKGYLVLTHGVQQVELTSDPLAILINGDQMVVANTTKREALRLFAEKKKLESSSRLDFPIHLLEIP